MKFAVIYGVIQMLFGVLLKGANAIYFVNWIDFVFEFIPQILFMSCTFGYMILMIFVKWGTDWSAYGTDQAPSIITLMINIPLKGGSTDGQPLWDQ
jgi:V-type H+-transporting ATPase subunit a